MSFDRAPSTQGYELLKERIKKEEIKFISFRFTDTRGLLRNICTTVAAFSPETLISGIPFDGSSVEGWKSIESSDMVLIPDPSTAYVDPFVSLPTMNIICDVIDPKTKAPYSKDPRNIAKKAVDYMKNKGVADTAYVGVEIEFFVFDSVRFSAGSENSFFELESVECQSSTHKKLDYGNSGYVPKPKGAYAVTGPMDSTNDLRSEILSTLQNVGIKALVHHHEVASSQCEIGFEFAQLVTTADQLQRTKYVVRNVVASYGKTVTFMPKPISTDNGSGMHSHHSIWKDGKNLFHNASDEDGISQLCRFYIGGILKHGKALAAFTNPTVNSYKRLLPGYEAPTILSYSPSNRSAAVRVPHFTSSTGKDARIEVRFPDATSNPYLCPAAILMAGIDGILNKIDPGTCEKIDFYTLKQEQSTKSRWLPSCLESALDSLDADRDFLKMGGVFSDEYINDYISLKRKEALLYSSCITPWEYAQYYAC